MMMALYLVSTPVACIVGSMMAYSLLGSTGRVGSTLISLRSGNTAIVLPPATASPSSWSQIVLRPDSQSLILLFMQLLLIVFRLPSQSFILLALQLDSPHPPS